MARKEFWSLNQDKIARLFFYLLILFLPTQLGKHFWPSSSFVYGLRLDYLSPTIYLTDVLILLVFIFGVKELAPKFKKVKKKHILSFFILILSLFVGVCFSKNPIEGIYGLLKLLELIFVTFYLAVNFRFLRKEIVFICFFVGISLESLLAFSQFINQGSLGGLFYFFGERTFNSQTPGIANASINGNLVLRPYGTFSHPNVLAGYLILSFLFLYYLKKEKYQQILGFLAGIMVTLTLFLTLSRIPILIWFICLTFFFCISIYEKYKNRKLNYKFILFSFMSLTAFILVFQQSIYFQRFSTTTFSDESLIQRRMLISQSFFMFFKNPVFGVGINNFYDNLDLAQISQKNLLLQPVHNIFFLTLSQSGMMGFIFLIYLFYVGFRRIFLDKTKQKVYLFFIFFTIIFLGMFDHYFFTLQQGQILFSLVIGTALHVKSG